MKSALSCCAFPFLLFVCKVPGHPSGEILQSGAVLHHPGRNLPGLPVHLQPHSQAPRHPLLPPATGNRPVPCHELLCARHQGEHRTLSDRCQPASGHEQPVGNKDRKDPDKSVGRSRTGTSQEEIWKLGTGLSLFFHPYGLSCLWPLLLWK